MNADDEKLVIELVEEMQKDARDAEERLKLSEDQFRARAQVILAKNNNYSLDEVEVSFYSILYPTGVVPSEYEVTGDTEIAIDGTAYDNPVGTWCTVRELINAG